MMQFSFIINSAPIDLIEFIFSLALGLTAGIIGIIENKSWVLLFFC